MGGGLGANLVDFTNNFEGSQKKFDEVYKLLLCQERILKH